MRVYSVQHVMEIMIRRHSSTQDVEGHTNTTRARSAAVLGGGELQREISPAKAFGVALTVTNYIRFVGVLFCRFCLQGLSGAGFSAA